MGKNIPFLDRLLTPEEMMQWAGLKKRELAEKTRTGVIPSIPWGERSVRYHPRTITEHYKPVTPKK